MCCWPVMQVEFEDAPPPKPAPAPAPKPDYILASSQANFQPLVSPRFPYVHALLRSSRASRTFINTTPHLPFLTRLSYTHTPFDPIIKPTSPCGPSFVASVLPIKSIQNGPSLHGSSAHRRTSGWCRVPTEDASELTASDISCLI